MMNLILWWFMISRVGTCKEKYWFSNERMDSKNILSIDTCLNEIIDSGRSYSNCTINITDCSFRRTAILNGNGGVIYANGVEYSMSILLSTFYGCSSSENGGAIYFIGKESYLNMICASHCYAHYYVYAYIEISMNNTIDYLSILNCYYEHGLNNPIGFLLNNHCLFSSNLSSNRAENVDAFGIANYNYLKCSYCTISDNYAYGYTSIEIYGGEGLFLFVNIINNYDTSNVFGLIFICNGAKYSLEYCIFDNNHATLFYCSSSEVEIANSYINHIGTFSSKDSITTISNNSFTQMQTYKFEFFQSQSCHADNPIPLPTPKPTRSAIKTLDPTPLQTPPSSPKQTPYRSYDSEITCQHPSNLEMSVVFTFLLIAWICQ